MGLFLHGQHQAVLEHKHILSRINSFTFQGHLTLHCSLKSPGCNRKFSSTFLLFSDPLAQKSAEEIILKREYFCMWDIIYSNHRDC